MNFIIWSSFAVLRIDWFINLAERYQFKDWLEEAAFGFLSRDMEIVLDGLQEGVDDTKPWVNRPGFAGDSISREDGAMNRCVKIKLTCHA